MSFKIHNGWKLNINDLKGLYNFTKSFGKTICDYREEQVAKRIFDILLYEYDRNTVLKDCSPLNLYSGLHRIVPAIYDTNGFQVTLNLDKIFPFSFILFPLEKYTLLAHYDNDTFSMDELLNNHFLIQEYAYSNNCDNSCTDISDEEWSQREQDWEEALDDEMFFANSGLSYLPVLPDFYTIMKRADLTKYLDQNYRCQNLVNLGTSHENDQFLEIDHSEHPIYELLKEIENPLNLLSSTYYTYLKDM